MSEYGSGISFSTARMYDKERIKHAFMGELMCGEDENGFIYAPASKEECEQYILSAYDNAVYDAIQAMAGEKVMKRFAEENGVPLSSGGFINKNFPRYSHLMHEELQKYDYIYETEVDYGVDDPIEYKKLSEVNGISNGARNALARSGINTVGKFLSKTAKELEKVRNFGNKSFKEAADALKRMGLTIPEDWEQKYRRIETEERFAKEHK